MRVILLMASALFASQAFAADTVFRCTDSSGRTIFSDKECGSVVEKIEYKHPESYYEKTMREHQESKAKYAEEEKLRAQEHEERKRRTAEVRRRHDEMCRARTSESGLYIGMPRSEIMNHDLWGYPDDLSKTTTSNGVNEYLVYKCEGHNSIRLFVTNGRLESIHN